MPRRKLRHKGRCKIRHMASREVRHKASRKGLGLEMDPGREDNFSSRQDRGRVGAVGRDRREMSQVRAGGVGVGGER